MMNSPTSGYKKEYYRFIIRQIARKNKWLFFLAKKHNVQPIFLQRIIDSLVEIVHLKKESTSISIGIVLNSNNVHLKQSPIEINAFHISNVSNFTTFGSSVSGYYLCYMVDNSGMVSIGRIPSKHLLGNATLTLKEISGVFKTVAFCIRQHMIEIYSYGELAQLYRNGKWTKPCLLDSYIETLSKQGFPSELLATVLNACKRLSETGKGGIIVITKESELHYCFSLAGENSFKKTKISEIPEKELLEFASLDGALIININSELIGIGQQLDPPSSKKAYKEPGRGTRHHSAADFSEAVDSAVFVVSENGPISLFFKGALFARCFGELFGS